MAKAKIADSDCPLCRRSVVWKKSPTGALSCTCQHCDLQLIARGDTEAARLIASSFAAPPDDPAPKPAPKAEPKPEPKPAAPVKSSPFGLGGF